jgi:hypothetical protein
VVGLIKKWPKKTIGGPKIEILIPETNDLTTSISEDDAGFGFGSKGLLLEIWLRRLLVVASSLRYSTSQIIDESFNLGL